MAEENKHKDWQPEKQRMHQVIDVIKQKIAVLKERAGKLKKDVINIRTEFWDDVTVNIEEMDDKIETEASIKQQVEFLSERERSHGQVSERLSVLDRLKDSPYFGRIDFKEDGKEEKDTIYIGLATVMDEKEEEFYVYDWRAPIASMYYDYPPGPASYETTSDNISGEITLKRQYIIRNGELKGMFDTSLTIGDHLLQSVLGNQANTKMRNIVSTIQKEQNKIIRNERSKVLVIQGAAGSGKTSAALQRVAYLLYRYRETLTSDQIILFSPNPLFSSYVSRVLPELGENNMQQMTFYQFLNKQLDDQFTLENPFDQMEYYLKNNRKSNDPRITAMSYKASMPFKSLVDEFLTNLSEEGLEFRNITFRGELVIPKEAIYQFFYKLDSELSIPARLEKTVHWILRGLKQLEWMEREKDWVLEETELLDKADYVEVHETLQEELRYSEDTFNDFNREEQLLRKLVVQRKLKPLRTKIERLQFVDSLKTFRHLFIEPKWKERKNLPSNWEEICELTDVYLLRKTLLWEDAPAYIYFEKSLFGFTSNQSIQHLFIDEAQDYSPFHFELLKKIFPASRMTLLGDINQAIYAHATEEESLLSENLEEEHERIVLKRSYRSTAPITRFTKEFMDNGHLIEAFERDGELPTVFEASQRRTIEDKIIETIQEYLNKGYETIAIIGKTIEECESIHKKMKKRMPLHFINHESHTFNRGIVVIPAYLAKGIEFDAVIIPDASIDHYKDELERNLFYTACTRAMHELSMFTRKEPCRFIKEVPASYYKHYKIFHIKSGQHDT
ncbi:DNA helicase-2/ATP-dependent DNA helicase PcrA [Gracilibacillus halotolerans]|uniref:DNA 3'-5' helicase n=1 Tax=Gracilibacillus halotolerans TaxID=74386 RepID=A0A841RIP1_9BACI|nr:RNA polymerase recycling motor HelD [Gracilibacillus halotolerans]MBB6512541.1 DNA helicase-2/ATP-dependent DNA helicase PcrA [Gracilibacillus halotolerans]